VKKEQKKTPMNEHGVSSSMRKRYERPMDKMK